MNGLDRAILTFLNGYSRQSWTFDVIVASLERNNLLKGGVIVAALWALWFRDGREGGSDAVRKIVLATFAGAFAALLVTQFLHWAVPFRIRPIHSPELLFHAPFGVASGILRHQTSFPSDHATLLSALVTGIFLISRRAGTLAFLYLSVFILLPRLYLGLHYPTDIAAGMLVGGGCAALANLPGPREAVTAPLLSLQASHAAWFYFLAFLVTYQTATLYRGTRELADVTLSVFGAIGSRLF